MNSNRKAFLDMLAVSEGTSTSKFTKNNGYDIIVVGIDGVWELIIDYSTHPFVNGRQSKVFNKAGQVSSASGRYQFLKRDWVHYRDLLQLNDKRLYPEGAFSPAAQDAWAIQLIKECSALADVDAGRFNEAIFKCRKIWASLPGAGYGQHENTLDKLQRAYLSAGGLFEKALIETIPNALPPAVPAVKGITTVFSLIEKLIRMLLGKK